MIDREFIGHLIGLAEFDGPAELRDGEVAPVSAVAFLQIVVRVGEADAGEKYGFGSKPDDDLEGLVEERICFVLLVRGEVRVGLAVEFRQACGIGRLHMDGQDEGREFH